jgi:AraC-like DNA-binding protein
MDIAAYLPDQLLRPFRAAVRGVHAVHDVMGLSELEGALRFYPVDVAVIDPQLVGLDALPALVAVLSRHAAVHVIAYTTVSPDAVRAHGVLAAHGFRHVMLRGFDDSPEAIRALLDALPADTLTDLLLPMVDELLRKVPPSLAHAIEELLRAPHTIASVDELARTAVMSRRTFDRALERAGLAPGWMLVRVARVVRAYHYLRTARASVRDVAAKLGYATERGFANEVHLVSGFLPSSLAVQLEPHDFLLRMATRLARSTQAMDHDELGEADDPHTADRSA